MPGCDGLITAPLDATRFLRALAGGEVFNEGGSLEAMMENPEYDPDPLDDDEDDTDDEDEIEQKKCLKNHTRARITLHKINIKITVIQKSKSITRQ